MTPRLRIAVALLLALPLGVPVPARAADTCTQQARRVRLPDGFAQARVSFVGVLTNGRNRVGEAFPGQGVRELRIVVDWTEIEHAHLQRIELSSPDGSLYQRLTGSFTGSRRPVSVTTRLPVAGTSITESSLFGEWCAEVFLDDEEAPIARHRFLLTPP